LQREGASLNKKEKKVKISKNWVVLLGTCILSTNAFAGSNRDVIQDLYNSGTEPATAEDFPERYFGSSDIIAQHGNMCVVLDGTDQPYSFDISRTIRYTPSEGPLVPEKTEEKLVFGDSHISYNLFQDPEVQGNNLVVSNPIYKTWVNGYDGTKHFVPAKMFATRAGKYIAFRIFIDHKVAGVRSENYYGYCYPCHEMPLLLK
jgi:hypothetical protein